MKKAKPAADAQNVGESRVAVIGAGNVGAATAYANLPPEPWHKRYDVKMDTYYTFSKTKNVLYLVFDSTRSDVFTELLAGMTPAEKSLFDGFTFFRNTTGTFNATNPAVKRIPRVESATPCHRIGRILAHSVSSPPAKRIKNKATMPSDCARRG